MAQIGKTKAISIHAPREGSDMCGAGITSRPITFLSTLPVRGATVDDVDGPICHALFLSTLPVRGATSEGRAGRLKSA